MLCDTVIFIEDKTHKKAHPAFRAFDEPHTQIHNVGLLLFDAIMIMNAIIIYTKEMQRRKAFNGSSIYVPFETIHIHVKTIVRLLNLIPTLTSIDGVWSFI